MQKQRCSSEENPFSRCPDNTAFKQQRLPAWQPHISAKTVLPCFFIIGLICLLLGIALIFTSKSIKEFRIDYTEGSCSDCAQLREDTRNSTKECQCTLNFSLLEDFQGDVFMYYGLRSFYQNHRQYMKSRDNGQLVGKPANMKKPSSYCAPFSKYRNGTPIAPCGAVANSLFNDTFHLVYVFNETTDIPVPLLRTGLAWWTDKHIKFQNPEPQDNLSAAFAGTARPPYWQREVYALDDTNESNNGFLNDEFIVWMRAAALPNFKKLYGRLSSIQEFTDGLPAGNYTLTISYNFPVTKFGGRKEMILSTVSWMGGKNSFFGIAYTTVGLAILAVGVILTVTYVKFGKKALYLKE
ncbi:transmembrane protein 30C [Latimeria chalumnae]|uniref:Cell cycle control protein n=1 Tax=Latimeria chalumnae TaxID=7897 RepID=M3XI70_LATCH|nr:PREDICTED: cell cycle control protein 50C-like [Latimeria chalumnae]|eukprot:XP_006009004.1 PREDICTED: cell cycle control protein 50C-like [Latimeria chalumnae]